MTYGIPKSSKTPFGKISHNKKCRQDSSPIYDIVDFLFLTEEVSSVEVLRGEDRFRQVHLVKC